MLRSSLMLARGPPPAFQICVSVSQWLCDRPPGRRGCAGAARRLGKILRCCRYAILPMRYAQETQAHLDPGQRTRQHQVVEAAEMADAEDLAGELAQARTQRHVESIEHDLA